MASFSEQMRRITSRYQQRTHQIVGIVRLELSSKIILKTPVDTGTARTSWIPTLGYYSNNTTERSSLNEVQQVAFNDLNKTFYLINNLPYIKRLEYGWSKQAPQGMVRLSIAEFQQVTRDAVLEVRRSI